MCTSRRWLIAWPRPPIARPRPLLAPPEPLLAPPEPLLAPPEPLLAPPEPLLAPPRPILAPRETRNPADPIQHRPTTRSSAPTRAGSRRSFRPTPAADAAVAAPSRTAAGPA